MVASIIPCSAFAGDMVSALSLGSSWGSKSLGLAHGFFPVMLIIGFVVELLFSEPGEQPNVRRTLWRAVLVFVLLTKLGSSAGGQTVYGWACFQLAGMSDSLTASLAPEDAFAKFAEVSEKWLKELNNSSPSSVGDVIALGGAGLGGVLFSMLIGLAMLIGQGAMWVMQELAKVLAILLYAIGPLALVFWLPKSSDSLSRWLRTFITILAWPVLSALILSIVVAGGLKGLDGASPAFASIATALLLSVTACAVPAIASALVGSSMGAIGGGLSALTTAGSVGTVGIAQMASKIPGAGRGGED